MVALNIPSIPNYPIMFQFPLRCFSELVLFLAATFIKLWLAISLLKRRTPSSHRCNFMPPPAGLLYTHLATQNLGFFHSKFTPQYWFSSGNTEWNLMAPLLATPLATQTKVLISTYAHVSIPFCHHRFRDNIPSHTQTVQLFTSITGYRIPYFSNHSATCSHFSFLDRRAS